MPSLGPAAETLPGTPPSIDVQFSSTGPAGLFMTAIPYPHLLSPLHVGPLRLRNRVVMGSMHTGLEDQPGGFAALADFYAERARGGVGLIVTGGFGPTPEALGQPALAEHATLCTPDQVARHRLVTDAVHREGAHILLQLVHVGRYDYGSGGVAPSPLRSPLSPHAPRALNEVDILALIEAFSHSAELAQQAGYDGVELMGSEGYLINQFLAPQTNQRQDRWGGSAEARRRFALAIVARIRERVSPGFLLMFRISLLDLVPEGSDWVEIVELARALEAAGVHVLNGGIGWHEARIPTIATLVPRAGFSWAARRLRQAVRIPVVSSNRINTPEVAEALLARGDADLVSLARPMLADADFVRKSASGRSDTINTCIACNQSCLDAAFDQRPVSCLVNPRACRERDWTVRPIATPLRIAVVGAGMAGLAFASQAAARGHRITLFEAEPEIGGQFRLAKRIPGKEEFAETLRYYAGELQRHGVELLLSQRVSAHELANATPRFDQVVLATGVLPRRPNIQGLEDSKVLSYAQAICAPHTLGARIAILGAGGIGFDLAELLSEPEAPHGDLLQSYLEEWGIDGSLSGRGGLRQPAPTRGPRQIWLHQRSPGKPGRKLARTTGWIRRTRLERRGVHMLGGVDYLGVDENGLQLRLDGLTQCLAVDHIVLCTGQESERSLLAPLRDLGMTVALIGGANVASELDARRAIEQGTRLALDL